LSDSSQHVEEEEAEAGLHKQIQAEVGIQSYFKRQEDVKEVQEECGEGDEVDCYHALSDTKDVFKEVDEENEVQQYEDDIAAPVLLEVEIDEGEGAMEGNGTKRRQLTHKKGWVLQPGSLLGLASLAIWGLVQGDRDTTEIVVGVGEEEGGEEEVVL
jgi:hypothetical protein